MASYLTLAEIPTVSLLYKLRRLVPAPEPLKSPSKPLNDIISLIRHDITKLDGVDCIVNAANNTLLGGGGVDHAIHHAAGRKLVEECRPLEGCATGDAKITFAYNLPNKRVIHAVGPRYKEALAQGEEMPEKLLRGCYRRSLQLAVEYEMKSIAFPALSAGVFGYPSEAAAHTALDETRKFLEMESNTGRLERVIFCNFQEKDEKAYGDFTPLYFPYAESQEPGNTQSSNASVSSGVLAASLPDPPTTEPKSEGQPESKKQKVTVPDLKALDAGTQTAPTPTFSAAMSEDDWEDLKGHDSRAESLEDDPVEIDRPSSATDVHSVQSSGIIDDMVHSRSTDGYLGKD